MAGIVIEPRLIYLECDGKKFTYRALPMGVSSFVPAEGVTSTGDPHRKGARLKDTLHYNPDRTKGFRAFPDTNFKLLKFLFSSYPPIFKHHMEPSDFFVSKLSVSEALLDRFRASPGKFRDGRTRGKDWNRRHQDLLRTLKDIPDTKGSYGKVVEVWSLFNPTKVRDPLSAGDPSISRASMMRRISRLSGVHNKPITFDFYKKSTTGKPVEGIMPLGVAFKTSFYHGEIPQDVANHVRPSDDHQARDLVRQHVYNSAKMEFWVPMSIVPAHLSQARIKNRGKGKYTPQVIKTHRVMAMSAGMARRKIKAAYGANIAKGGARGDYAQIYYLAWKDNNFKVVPYAGVTPYRKLYST